MILTTITACGDRKDNKIASIPEASGISYCKNSDTLMVVDDEGTLYEITPHGETLLKYRLGNYDLEGVVCEDSDVVIAIENGYLLKVNRKSLKIERLKIIGDIIKFSKKSGIEGIAKVNDLYYLTIQSKSKKGAKIVIVKIDLNYAKIIKTIRHEIIDSSGMEYYRDKLYIVSDKMDKLYILKDNTVLKEIKLKKFAQEGVTIDSRGNFYFADDNGAIFRYKVNEI